MVPLGGVEPPFPDYETGVLPLHTMGAIGSSYWDRTSDLYSVNVAFVPLN